MKVGNYTHYFYNKNNPTIIHRQDINLDWDGFLLEQERANRQFGGKVESVLIKTVVNCEIEINVDITKQ